MSEQIALIAKAIDCRALAFAEVFERVVGVERVEVHLEFLPVAGGVQPIGGAAIEIGQLQAVDQAQYLVVGGWVFSTEKYQLTVCSSSDSLIWLEIRAILRAPTPKPRAMMPA
jgi:hypothetical protein